jgi:hypothetical protein
MTEIIYVTDVVPLEGHRIRAMFSDGAIKEIDLSELLAAGGVFAPIHEQREIFEQVASGHRIQRRTIRGPVTAAA